MGKYNKIYNEEILRIRNFNKMFFENKNNNLDEPTSFWCGKELFKNEKINSLTIILKTRGCYWAHNGGCSMCGYINDSSIETPKTQNLEKQLILSLKAIETFDKVIVKIFTSGSFFDENEISEDARNKIFQILNNNNKIIKVSFETRPEFINEKLVKSITSKIINKKIEFAFGLESSSDVIRTESINKGFLFTDFEKACTIGKKYNISNKVYLLLKPPFLSEKEAIVDMLKSIDDIHLLADIISINPCTIQKFTFLEKLWKNYEYNTPWIWSLIKILIEAKKKYTNLMIISDPTALGSKRGIHNRCENCNNEISKLLKNFSLSQDISVLESFYCDCKYKWKKELQLSVNSFGSTFRK